MIASSPPVHAGGFLLWTTFYRVAWSTAVGAMFGNRFHSLVFVSAQSDALPIRKHEPLMRANFLYYVLGHFDAQAVGGPSDGFH